MKRWFTVLICVIVGLLTSVDCTAQDKPIITVLDFKTNNVSEKDMRSIVSLLSSALFQTSRYRVIDVNQRETLLKELEFSASDCTDETCQLEIGKLLSAEMIVVGDISRIGKRYILSSKVLETVTADTISSADGIYQDMESMIDDVHGIAGRLADMSETAGKPAPPAKEEKTPREKKPDRPNRVLLTTGIGLTLPVGKFAPAVKPGIYSPIVLSYSWELEWGWVSAVLYTGCNIAGTKSTALYRSRLYSIPLAAGFRYTTTQIDPLFVFLETGGGITLNFLRYREEYPDTSNTGAAKPFFTAAPGLGIFLSSRIGISAFSGILMFFFDDGLYMGIAPGIRLEVVL